jgi:hypothetical protein
MSEDIFAVAVPFSDVASLAQGYLDRADGDRLLLPFSKPIAVGSVVRFVVYLADGTPAFAGAGLCSQSSDQGPEVDPEQRFETLLDSLRFDARSRPVYDYIVAVRAAAYAQRASSADAHGHSAIEEADSTQDEPEVDVDATAVLDLFAQHRREGAVQQLDDSDERDERAPRAVDYASDTGARERLERANGFGEVTAVQSQLQNGERDDLALRLSNADAPSTGSVNREPSFIPPPIPTGLLTRPARTMHWQPAPPRRPTPRPASGLFRYGPAGLPRPARPPRPELDASSWVSRAPRP